MNFSFLDDLQFIPDMESLSKRLRIQEDHPLRNDFDQFISEMSPLARPKAFYRIAFIDQKDADELVINGVRFHSHVLCVNLAEVDRVFAYIATCGLELYQQRQKESDMLRQYWLDALMESALRTALAAVNEDLQRRYSPAKLSGMNPGSLADWPITQQKPFFDLLGEESRVTGVSLTESMLMVPAKSVTGIYFETEREFVNCQLCPREKCPNRRADYNPQLMGQYR